MIIAFDKINQYDILLSGIRAILQEPTYRLLVQKNRPCNGFLCVLRGECVYEFEGGSFTLSKGAVAYLPFGSRHTLTVTSEDISFYRVDFTVRIENEIVLFSDKPIKLADSVSAECLGAMSALAGDYGIGENSVERTKQLCVILSGLGKSSASPTAKRLMPAVEYLRENATKGADCGVLAELCFLSTSRFYDLFKSEFGVTPLEYRDNLIIRRAAALLAAGDITVKEAAFAVGFDDAAYFSRFFKKHMGVTPCEYAENSRNKSFISEF